MEDTKSAGIFEDEAVFVNKDENEPDRFEVIARSDDVFKLGNFGNAGEILDSSGNAQQPLEQNDVAEHRRLPEKPRSCLSLSSLALSNAMSSSSRVQSGKRIGFGTIIFAVVFVATTRWRRDSCQETPFNGIALEAGGAFGPYKHSAPAFARTNRRDTWKVTKLASTSNSTISTSRQSWKEASVDLWHRLLNERAEPFCGARDSGSVNPFLLKYLDLLDGITNVNASNPPVRTERLVQERVTSLTLSYANANVATDTVTWVPLASRKASVNPTRTSQAVESSNPRLDATLRFRIDPNAGTYEYPEDPDIEFLTNETFYQAIGAASEASPRTGAVFVNFFLHLCPSCSGEHPVRSRSWREYAAAVRALDVPVKVAAIDCLAYMDICREQLVTSFPRHRWYQRQDGRGVDFTYRKTADDFMQFTQERLSSI